MSFGENLKRLRRDKGWTQGELAKTAGIKITHIPNLENNKSDPKLSTIYKLMMALECTPDALLTDMEKASNEVKMQAALERLNELSDAQQHVVIDLIDKYCIASAFTAQINEKSLLPIINSHLLLWKDQPAPMADQEKIENYYITKTKK